MIVDVVFLPRELTAEHLHQRTVIVFDVLRATTSMAAALAADVLEIRLFGDIAAAADACRIFAGSSLLCGEINALPPERFDLGKSPRQFNPREHAARTVFISTTNGTLAILAARSAAAVLIGALVNASATASAALEMGRDITLLCAGTTGQVAAEDIIGAGAVLSVLSVATPVIDASDNVMIARAVYAAAQPDLVGTLQKTRGGRNVIAAGLSADIDYCVRLDSLDIVGHVTGEVPTVRRLVTV